MDLIRNNYLDISEDQIDKILQELKIIDNSDNGNKNKCKYCKSIKLTIDNTKGHTVCMDCATINSDFIEEYIDYYNNDTSNSAYYGNPSSFFFPKTSLGTKIVSGKYNKLSLIQKQGQVPYKEKSLMEALEKIQKECNENNITQTIIDSAKILYKKISETTHSKGKRIGKNIIMRCINRRSMIAACLFHACKNQNETRSPKEIADIYDLDIKNVNRGCRKFYDNIGNIGNNHFHLIKSSKPIDFINRFCNKIEIADEYLEHIRNIAINIEKIGIPLTHEPPSIAAGCILLIVEFHKLNITKKQISSIFGLSDVTISKTYRKLIIWYKILINNNIVDLIIQRLKLRLL